MMIIYYIWQIQIHGYDKNVPTWKRFGLMFFWHLLHLDPLTLSYRTSIFIIYLYYDF